MIERSKEWWMDKARAEGESEVTAGAEPTTSTAIPQPRPVSAEREGAIRESANNVYREGGALSSVVREVLSLLDWERARVDLLEKRLATPIPMVLMCPNCGFNHIDLGEWATRPHRTHLCLNCNAKWRPSNTATVGVIELAKE